MKEYKIKENIDLQSKNIKKIVENCFGTPCTEKSDKENHEYYIQEPEKTVLNKVYIEVDVENRIVKLDVEEKPVNQLKEDGLISKAPEAFKSKNKLLRKLTGKTVSERKKELKSESLPDSKIIDKPEI